MEHRVRSQNLESRIQEGVPQCPLYLFPVSLVSPVSPQIVRSA
jgi:hypothetical protein